MNRSRPASSFAATAVLAPPALAAALLIAGCAPDKENYGGPRGPEYFNACALFPASDARTELRGLEIGQVSGPLDATSGSDFARCAYGYGPEATVVVALEVRRHDGPRTLRRKIEASLPLLRRLTEGDVAEVHGLGDVAWWAGEELRLLKVGWRDLELLVTVHPGDEPGFQRAVAERIARRALHRLAEEPIPEELELAPRTVTLGVAAEAGSALDGDAEAPASSP